MSPPPRTTGSIILLNGTSSAGKSTLATAVQDVMDAPYLHLGIDLFFEALPQRYLARLAPDVVPPPQAHEGGVWVCTEPGGHGFRELRVAERLYLLSAAPTRMLVGQSSLGSVPTNRLPPAPHLLNGTCLLASTFASKCLGFTSRTKRQTR
jgi:hypothetical protein